MKSGLRKVPFNIPSCIVQERLDSGDSSLLENSVYERDVKENARVSVKYQDILVRFFDHPIRLTGVKSAF
jgi:hypothetical protein